MSRRHDSANGSWLRSVFVELAFIFPKIGLQNVIQKANIKAQSAAGNGHNELETHLEQTPWSFRKVLRCLRNVVANFLNM